MGLSSSNPARRRLFERLDAYVASLGHGGPSAFEASRLLFRSHHAALEARSEIARTHGLTPAALISLLLLRACYPDELITPTELRDAVMLSSGGMTKVLRGLERRGLLARHGHPTDARSSTLVLTRDGVELIDAMVPQIEEADRELLVSPLSEPELAELVRLLRKVGAAYRRR